MTFKIVFSIMSRQIYFSFTFDEQTKSIEERRGTTREKKENPHHEQFWLFHQLAILIGSGSRLLSFRICRVIHRHKCDHGRKPSLAIHGYRVKTVLPTA